MEQAAKRSTSPIARSVAPRSSAPASELIVPPGSWEPLLNGGFRYAANPSHLGQISYRAAGAIEKVLARHGREKTPDLELPEATALIEAILETVVHRAIERHPLGIAADRMLAQCRRLIMATSCEVRLIASDDPLRDPTIMVNPPTRPFSNVAAAACGEKDPLARRVN